MLDMIDKHPTAEQLDVEIDGLISKVISGNAEEADLARYNELVTTRIQQSHFTREMALEDQRTSGHRG